MKTNHDEKHWVFRPIKKGLNHKWKIGETGLLACGINPPRKVVIETHGNSITCLSGDGMVCYSNIDSLLTIEGYLAHCDYMQQDWTGREYCQALENARAGLALIVNEKWFEAFTRATADAPFDAVTENDLWPSEKWSFETKIPRALKNASCPQCGAKPETLNPLPEGWCWDTMEPVNSGVWCPIHGIKTP